MMKRLLSFCLVFALGTLLAVAGEKITYRFAPELGKTFTYRITTTSEFSNSTNESKKVETSITTHIKATSLENDVYTVKMSLRDLTVSLPDMPKNADMEAVFKKVNEMVSQVTITSKIDIHGDKVGKPEFKGLPKELMGQITAQLGQMDVSSQSTNFPKTPLGEGDTWNYNLKISQKEMDMECRLVKITPTSFFVTTKGNVKTNKEKEGDISVEGEIQFDRLTGQQIQSNTKIIIHENGRASIIHEKSQLVK